MAMSALAVADTKKASPQRRASWVAFALLLPGLAYLALFFVVPFVSLLMTSFGVKQSCSSITSISSGPIPAAS